MTRAIAHSFSPFLSLRSIQIGGIFWQTFRIGEFTDSQNCLFCSPATPTVAKPVPPVLVPKPSPLPPFFQSRNFWKTDCDPTQDLTGLGKAQLMGHVTHGTFAYDGNAWATHPSLASHHWGTAPWHTHVFTDKVSHAFGPQFCTPHPTPTRSYFKANPPLSVPRDWVRYCQRPL